MITNTTGAPDGAAPDPVPPSVNAAAPIGPNEKLSEEAPHRPEPPTGERRTTFDTVIQVGWMLLIVVTLSEKAPVALLALVAATAFCLHRSRR